MAYEPLDIKIVPGGLNLLAPGDSVAPGDCLNLEGFWPGAVGKLEQAPGYDNYSDIHLGTWFDSLCQTSGRTYFGGGGSLYQVGRAAEAAIDTGFDPGYPLAMLGYQGYVWIMNAAAGKQRKDDGTTVTAWTPEPPGAPALTNPATTSATFDVTTCQPEVPDTGGDFTQIWMWTTDSVAGVEVGAQVTISGIAAGTSEPMNGTWTVLEIFAGGSSLIKLLGSTPSTTVFTAAAGIHWTFANRGVPLGEYKYWITWQYADLGESNPSTSAGVITPATLTVADPGTKIVVDAGTAIAAAPEGVIGWNVYRQGPGLFSPYRVNGATRGLDVTTFEDFADEVHSQDNQYLIDSRGILMESDHNPAPPCRVIANQTYNGRIVVANTAEHPNRVYYTPALQPGFFRGPDILGGDWVDIGTDRGDEVLFLAVKPSQIIVYRRKSIWRILHDFGEGNARIDPVVPDFGIVGPRAVACTGLGDYIRATEGIYKFNGDWAQKISPKLDPVFRGLSQGAFAAEDSAYRSKCALGFHGGRLWVSYTAAGGAMNNRSFVFHVETERWFNRRLGVGAFADTGTRFLAGSFGRILALESETSFEDDGTATILTYQSAFEDGGKPDHEKTWADLVVEHNTMNELLAIRVRTNKSAVVAADEFTLAATLQSNVLTKSVIPLVYPAGHTIGGVSVAGEPIRSYNLSVLIDGNGATSSPGVRIDSPLILHYYLEARKARVFDTDETDHGLPGVVKTVDQVEFDIDASAGAGALQIYSDLPGGAMAPRLAPAAAIPQTAGRQTVKVILAAPVEGKLLRYQATTTTGFHVYGFRVRLTPIGVHVDGAISEVWDTRPIPLVS